MRAILAGTYSEATFYAQGQHWLLSTWFFVRSPAWLRGHQDVELHVVGSWRKRYDLDAVMNGLHQCGWHYWFQKEDAVLPKHWMIVQQHGHFPRDQNDVCLFGSMGATWV